MTLVPFPDSAPDTPSPFGEFIQPARNFVCEIWRDHPGWVLSGSGVGLPGAVALMDRMCPPPFPSPAPPTPVPGGQCPVNYNVNYRIVFDRSDGVGYNLTRSTGSLPGRIGGVVAEQSRGANGRSLEQSDYISYNSGASRIPTHSFVVADGSGGFGRTEIISIVRLDGQPDNCGDGLPTYPPSQPAPDDLSRNININIGGVSVSAPITLIPTVIAPTLNFAPVIGVTLGGVDLDFYLDGIDVTIPPFPGSPPRFPTGTDPRPNPPSPRPPARPPNPPRGTPPGGGSGDCPDVDITRVISELTRLDSKYTTLLDCDRCVPDSPSPLSYDEVLVFEGNSAQLALPVQCRYVRINFTIDLSSAKTQSGNDADDIFYIGWASFKTFGGNQPRQPIHYQAALYPVPLLAQLFTFTCYTGYIARVTFINEKEE